LTLNIGQQRLFFKEVAPRPEATAQ